MPIKLGYCSKPVFKDRAYLVNVVEDLQKASRSRVPIFTTPKALTKNGFPIVNNTEHPIIISKGDRVATVENSESFRANKNDKISGVADTGR